MISRPSLVNDSVEVAADLAVAVADQETKRRSPLLERPGELACLLNNPVAGRVRGAAGHVDASAAEFDEEEHIQSLERDRLDGEEVDREHGRCLRSHEGRPGQPRALADRAKSLLPQDLCHGRRRDGDAQATQLTGDPLVAPARVLAGQPEYKVADLAADRRSPAATAICPAAGDEPPVPAQRVVGVTRNDRQLDRGNSRLAAVSKTRSVIASCGRRVCRRSTESSCRSTTISTSLNPSERRQSDATPNKHRNARYQSDQNKNQLLGISGDGRTTLRPACTPQTRNRVNAPHTAIGRSHSSAT